MAFAASVRLLKNLFPTVAPATETAVDAAIEQSARRIQAGAMVRTPVVTGLLRRGWASRPVEDGWEVANRVNYASYVEWGTRYVAPRGMLTQAVAQEVPRLRASVAAAVKGAMPR